MPAAVVVVDCCAIPLCVVFLVGAGAAAVAAARSIFSVLQVRVSSWYKMFMNQWIVYRIDNLFHGFVIENPSRRYPGRFLAVVTTRS